MFAISLRQGREPTKAWKLVEHLGSAEAVFQASLTELEGTGTKAVSAESIATGKSAELAGEEISRAAGGGVTIASGEDICYPQRLEEIYDPRWGYRFGAIPQCCGSLATQGGMIISGMARGVDTPPAIAARSRPK